MTGPKVEGILRDAFRNHEHLVAGAHERLLPAVYARRRRRGALRVAAAGLATLLVLVGAAMLWRHQDGRWGAVPAGSPVSAAPAYSAPPGWRLESSLGVQLAVPAGWGINDYRCGMSGRPTVVRGRGVIDACGFTEPPTLEVAIIGPPGTAPGPGASPTVIDGVAATRLERRLNDGRYAGWIVLPAPRNVVVEVRTLHRETTTAILDSVRPVTVDHLGCATDRPGRGRPPAAGGSTFVTPAPVEIDVCYYGEESSAVLQASTGLAGPTAETLAQRLNAAPTGRTPDAPQNCTDHTQARPNAVLLVHGPGGAMQQIWVTFEGCVGRGLDNGVRYAQLRMGLINTFMAPLRTGFGVTGDLPQ